MFDKHLADSRGVAKAEVQPFLCWFADIDQQEVRAQARDMMLKALEVVPGLRVWETTAQSGPWHCEGPHLADHIERILVGVMNDGSLGDIEEFAREKDLGLEIVALEATLHKNRDFLIAFAVLHDAAKSTTLTFDALGGSRGAHEGFMVRHKEGMKKATEAEKRRYDKLYRAYIASHDEQSAVQKMIGFYETYGIAAHYPGHESEGVTSAYTIDRQMVLQAFGVPVAHAKLLTELIRYHIEVLGSFVNKIDKQKYEIMMARAGKAGLNVDVFLDLMLAVAYLDAVAGGVACVDGKAVAQTQLVINILRAEREAYPRRHEERVRVAESEKKRLYKEALDKAGISGEAVFQLLQTPFGPERGVIMEQVWLAIKDRSYKLDVGEHSAELARRIELAREILASYNAVV